MSDFAAVGTRRPNPTGLPRPRLLTPLVSDRGPGVVVVLAPPGSGKTTLLARAAALTSRPAGWCLAGPEDRSEGIFLAHLSRVAGQALGRDLGAPGTAAQLAAVLDSLPDRPLLLVLDDVHELAGSAAENELEELLRCRPPHVRLALGTRRPLGFNTPRLMVSGELVELDSEALRFRSWEVEELFRVVYREPLSPEGAAALTRRTGGWAAGLMLFHLSTTGKSAVARERAVADLDGRSRLLRSYLTRTVLDELDPERREFLLATCTLGRLTGSLCDALLHRQGSARVLEDLASHQFFTTLAESGRTYRYHQVLQTLLEGLLVDERGPRAAAQLYAASARLLEQDGQPREALRAYAMADDFASVARVLQQSGAALAVDPQVTLASPGDDDPWLALVGARRLQRSGAVVEAVAAYRGAEALFEDSEFRRRCQEERAAASVWLADAAVPDHPGTGLATPRGTAQAVRAATRRLPGADRLPPYPLAQGVVLLLAGEAVRAAHTLAHVAATTPPEQLVADLARVVAEIVGGIDEDPVGTLEQIALTAEVEEQPWLARAARGVQAAVLLVASGEAWREESCAALVEDCERSGDGWGAALLAGSFGVAQVRRGAPSARAWLDRARDGLAALGAPLLEAWAATAGAYAARQAGAPDAEERTGRARALARAAGLVFPERLLAERLGVGPRPSTVRHRVLVRCLGPFGIEVDGARVALPPLRPRPRELLLLLALHHGRDVHREVLIDRLWPEATLEVATHRLHAATSSVRRCLAEASLGEGVVRRHGNAYSLCLDGAVLDVAEFESRLREAGRLERTGHQRRTLATLLDALELYQGELLGEAGPAEWVVSERERLRVAAATAAYTAAQLALWLRAPSEALPLARLATVLDPLRDTAWVLLAETQERMGDAGSAAATRREHASVAAQLTWP